MTRIKNKMASHEVILFVSLDRISLPLPENPDLEIQIKHKPLSGSVLLYMCYSHGCKLSNDEKTGWDLTRVLLQQNTHH
jgi:hypothetical protein